MDRGDLHPRPKIAKFKKLRSSLRVLNRRMKDYKKQLQSSARLEFDDQESSLITRLLGLLKHYLQKTISIFNYNLQADFLMQKNSPAPGVRVGLLAGFLPSFWSESWVSDSDKRHFLSLFVTLILQLVNFLGRK